MTSVAGAIRVRHTFPVLMFAGLFAPPAVAAPDRERDRQLLSRVAHGDVSALRVLYDQHAGRAMAIAARILKSTAEAEEIVQETFLELWKRSAEYDRQRGGAVAW